MKISPRDKKIKGPKCGQCEMKAAHVVRILVQNSVTIYNKILQQCHFATPQLSGSYVKPKLCYYLCRIVLNVERITALHVLLRFISREH